MEFAVWERLARNASRQLAVTGLVLLLTFAFLSVIDGLARQILKQPIDFVRDLGGLVVAASITLCTPAGLVQNSHISVRLLESILPAKCVVLLDAVAAIAISALVMAVSKELWVYAGKVRLSGQATFLLQIRTWQFWYVVAGIFWIASFVQVIMAIASVRRACGLPSEINSPGETNVAI